MSQKHRNTGRIILKWRHPAASKSDQIKPIEVAC